MNSRPSRRSIIALTLASIFAAALVFGTAASASDPFPVQETFRGPTLGSSWRRGGSAELTGSREAEGWLRLTSAEGGEFGYAYDDEAFPSTDGALVEFEYADWGGSGADGLTFFLFDGATSEAEFHAGQPGGALGYASCFSSTNGLTNAYVGVGFDEYGNFTNLGSICGLGGTEFLPNHISVRGSASESYKLLATAPTTESLRAERSQARRVTIAITPAGKLSVYVGYPDGTYQPVTQSFQLPPAPGTLKFGYVASTGALTDYHEIRDAQVVEPTQLTPSIAQTAGGHERGEPLTWTAVVRNEGPNPTQREQLHASTGQQSLSNVRWTCEAAAGAECGTAEGTGLPSPEAGAMPQGSSLTYTITATPTATSDYAQMTLASEPRGDTGELDPERERATARTNLTPLFAEEPSFTLAANGEATATTVSALGGEISYGYAWQRCEANGTSCTDIPGAQATTYRTTGADVGRTIRFTETATNTAGGATADSVFYRPPTAEITSAPAPHTASREAAFSFTASTSEATLQCSLDGAAWSACTSSLSYHGLADGGHTFSVRAVYGGLSSAEPASVRWTVEATPPPAPTIVSAPSSPSVQLDPTFEFGGLVEGDILECQLDGGGWQPCSARTALTGLTEGAHELQARQVNHAGLDSGVTSYAWTIEVIPVSPPAPVSTLAPESTPSSAGTPPPSALVASATTHAARVVGKRGSELRRRPRPDAWKDAGHRHRRAGRKRRRRREASRRHRAAGHRRSAPQRRRPPTRAPKHRARRLRSRHRHTAAPHRHPSKLRSIAKREPKASTHRSLSRSRPKASTHRSLSRSRPKATSHRPRRRDTKVHGRPHPATRTHTRPTRAPAAHPPAARPPAATPRPERKSPAPTSTPTSTQGPPRRGAPRIRHIKGHRPAARRRSTRPPAAKQTPKDTTHAPAAAPTPKRKAPAQAPAQRTRGPQGKAHPQSAGRTRKASARHKARANPAIRPFRPRSASLTPRARRRVERLAAAMVHARLVVCVGYTDDLGARSANLALGLARARAVCAKLRAFGVRAAFKAESRGPEDPCASNATASGRALNRRVELRIVY